MKDPTLLDIPDFSLVLLVGATGSGKSTFAAKWFAQTEIVSSDRCRGMIADDENDQAVSSDAFDLAHAIAGKRLKNRKLVVVDATNVRASDRREWVEIARAWHALPVAIVIDPGLDVCVARNRERPDRQFGPQVPQRMISEIRRGQRGLKDEGFRHVWRLTSVEATEAAKITRSPLWTDRRVEPGPFDIVGDVHGCADELESLLAALGYVVTWQDKQPTITHPEARKLVFVGDLVDRGPRSPDVLRLVMAAVAAGHLCVQGNHDQKLYRYLSGRKVTVNHGLQETIDQLEAEPAAFRGEVKAFLDTLRSHYWLDGGALAVAHAGLKAEMIGRGSAAVRAFACYGDTTGETDDAGLPVRLDWAQDYRGKTVVVYGHTPIAAPQWVNGTINIDSGCVFGGGLTALRWPERELVEVPAARRYAEPVRPLTGPGSLQSAQAAADRLLDHADVSGRRWIDTTLMRRIVVAEENASAALEVMGRFAVAPQWLVYLPPTMSPVETSAQEGWLERPEEAFAYYREQGVADVVLEEKHMGSRAILAICRDVETAHRRFGTIGDEAGMVWTRTGRAFFNDRAMGEALLDRVRAAAEVSGVFDELASDWLLLDAEIMPWSAKASALIAHQYEPLAVSACAGLGFALEAATRAAARGVPAETMCERLAGRAQKAARYARAWAPYAWPVGGVDDLRVAPFHVLASEGAAHLDKDHVWHMEMADRLVAAGRPTLAATQMRRLALADEAACAEAALWWEMLTRAGGEGMVVKPLDFAPRGARGLVQPALKVRGPEYLRIIYGPEYDAPENLERLRKRGVGRKRGMALREFALGHEALTRLVAGAPLRRIHECVFAVLALESEPIDPRL